MGGSAVLLLLIQSQYDWDDVQIDLKPCVALAQFFSVLFTNFQGSGEPANLFAWGWTSLSPKKWNGAVRAPLHFFTETQPPSRLFPNLVQDSPSIMTCFAKCPLDPIEMGPFFSMRRRRCLTRRVPRGRVLESRVSNPSPPGHCRLCRCQCLLGCFCEGSIQPDALRHLPRTRHQRARQARRRKEGRTWSAARKRGVDERRGWSCAYTWTIQSGLPDRAP